MDVVVVSVDVVMVSLDDVVVSVHERRFGKEYSSAAAPSCPILRNGSCCFINLESSPVEDAPTQSNSSFESRYLPKPSLLVDPLLMRS